MDTHSPEPRTESAAIRDVADAAARVAAVLRDYPGGGVVALSGGCDSELVLSLAAEALGASQVVAVTSRSESLAAGELADARAAAARAGVEHVVLRGGETELDAFRKNAPDRCFHCKNHLYGEFRKVADERGLPHVFDGTNADDPGDHRPGLAAGLKHRVVSPLLEAGLTKPWARALARHRGLELWDKPSEACLSSRFPYGTEVTPEALMRVERCENVLRGLGFRALRVRVHDDTARIEVPLAEAGALLAPGVREQVVAGLRAEGFTYVALDLEGLRSGSLNEGLRGPRAGGTGEDRASAPGATIP